MPSSTKTSPQPSARPQATKTACARLEKSDRAISRIGESLAAAQKDLSEIGGTLESGAGNLSKDVTKLIRDARREVTKMSKLVRRDLDHLQTGRSVSSETKPRRIRPAASKAKAGRASRARGASA